MSIDLCHAIDAFAGLRTLVIGDAILDRYLHGGSLRFCREAPVPNVTLSHRCDTAGGAANAAVNLKALGADVHLATVLGDDAEGEVLRRVLREEDVETDAVVMQPGRATRTKHRVIAESQLLLSFDSGDIRAIAPQAQEELLRLAARHAAHADAIVLSDYGYGTLPDSMIAQLARMLRSRNKVVVVDSRHRLSRFRPLRPTAVKPNREEVSELLGARVLDTAGSMPDTVAARGEMILKQAGARFAAVTLDRDGAVLLQRGERPRRLFNRPVVVRNAAGAGDTFVAALTLSLAAELPWESAGEVAIAAATVAIGKPGTAPCSAEELRACFAPEGKFVADLAHLVERVRAYRAQGRRIVFTNGCFDILHRGHVTLLERAKAQGDVLIVAVNSDAGIRHVKGPGRPINALEDRIQVLAALGCVDHVVGFDEDTCSGLVRALRPDVFVKGSTYTRETLPEAPVVEAMGGVVHFIPHLRDRSTAGLIERIKQPRDAAEPRAAAVADPRVADV